MPTLLAMEPFAIFLTSKENEPILKEMSDWVWIPLKFKISARNKSKNSKEC